MAFEGDHRFEQTLLDIEVLAVQIEEHNRLKRQLQADKYHKQLTIDKEREYSQFKQALKGSLSQHVPFTLGSMALGMLCTRTLILGSFAGISIYSLLQGLRPWSLQAKGEESTAN
jgi:hypothetical protein